MSRAITQSSQCVDSRIVAFNLDIQMITRLTIDIFYSFNFGFTLTIELITSLSIDIFYSVIFTFNLDFQLIILGET